MIAEVISRTALALMLWLLWSLPVQAHDLTMSVLVLHELTPGEYDVKLERAQGITDPSAAYLLLRPRFPAHCRFAPPRLVCGARGLSGTVGFLGLGELGSSILVRVERRGGRVDTYAFSAGRPELSLRDQGTQRGLLQVAFSFVPVGVEHIGLGLDHLAFVLGLLWLVRGRRALLGTVTAFTLGHSVTLSAAALDYVSVPAAPVEACIALSIAFVALELVRRERTQLPASSHRTPYALAAAFGLLHGLGFANALSELGVAREELPGALLGFNLGVELGQLAFVTLALTLAAVAPARLRAPALRRANHYALGALAMYWCFDRVSALIAS